MSKQCASAFCWHCIEASKSTYTLHYAYRLERVQETFRLCLWKKPLHSAHPIEKWPCTKDWKWLSIQWARLKSASLATTSLTLSTFVNLHLCIIYQVLQHASTGCGKKCPLKMFANISLTNKNFKRKFYTPILCSYLCKITKFLFTYL